MKKCEVRVHDFRLQRIAPWLVLLALGLVGVMGCEGAPGDPAPDEAPAEVPTRPEQADPEDWCAGHGVPESMCTVCHPELIEEFKAAGDWCAEHGFPESACPQCNPMEPPEAAGEGGVAPGTRVRFRAPELEGVIGLERVEATMGAMGVAVEAPARVVFDENRIARVRAALPGIVRRLRVDLGDRVEEGDALFTLESVGVADLQGRRRAARERVEAAEANLRRQEELRRDQINSARQVELARRELETAQAELRAAEQSLAITGAPSQGRSGRFVVRAPLGGAVIRRPAVLGSFASQADSLATLADTSRMWVMLEVSEWDVGQVRVGQPVQVRVDGVSGAFEGELSWVASEVDARTRTVQARAEVANPEGSLRDGQFARASVQVAPPAGSVTVPRSSVQRHGEESVVFVRLEEGVYEPRVVEPGRSSGRVIQVAGRLEPGEQVVTKGAFLLRTELMRDSIGAGCCEVEGPGGQ